jgi:hypothetical protein
MEPLLCGAGSPRHRQTARRRLPSLTVHLLHLLARRDQQLRIRRQDLTHRVLKLPTRSHALSQLLNPNHVDLMDVLFPLHREREGPDRMSRALGTMTSGLAATQAAEGKGAMKQIIGDTKRTYDPEFSLPQMRGRATSRLGFDIVITTPQDKPHARTFFQCENRTSAAPTRAPAPIKDLSGDSRTRACPFSEMADPAS